MKDILIKEYNNTINLNLPYKEPKNSFNIHFVNCASCEILGPEDNDYHVIFKDNKTGKIHHEADITNNMWTKCNIAYFVEWKIEVYSKGELVFEHLYDAKNKKVYVHLESSAIGDTLAWFPPIEEFRKKHNCHVIVSTFRNDMFEKIYPNIEFVARGQVVNNIKALYRLGWFYDKDKEPILPSLVPLQKSATNILGLDYTELHSPIFFEPKERPYSEKYVCIAPSSTAGCKLWNNPTGWVELTKYLKEKGYKVVNISKDGENIEGVDMIEDDSMENTKNVIYHSEFMIGLSSGLSWLSWALGKHVVMISNFTEANHEFNINCTRIINQSVCNGCWNNPKFKFDKGDWYWCPEHKGTERQFECHKSITADMVINQIQHLL